VNLAIFGEPQKFFTDNGFKTVNTLDASSLKTVSPTTAWIFSVAGVDVDGQNVAKGVIAQIDTTTEFITVDADSYDSITAKLGNIVQSVSGDSVNQYADSAEVDGLKQRINFQVDTLGKTDISIDARNFFRSVDGISAKEVFLVRKGPKTTGTALWTLGRAFLTSVYTNFQVGPVGQPNSLQFGEANNFRVQPIALNTTKRAWLIALGVTLFVVSVFVVLRLLKPLGYVAPPPPKTSPKQSVKLIPTQVVYQAQPAFYQAQPLVFSQVQVPAQATTSQTFPAFRAQGSPTRINATFTGAQQSTFPRQQ